MLRRRLADSPRHVRLLEERLRETEASVASVTGQNERLADTLREARDQIVALKEEVDRLAQPPSGFGVFLEACEDGTADVFTGGRKMRVSVSPAVELDKLRPGQEVVLNEALNVVIAQGYETVGEVVMLKELLEDGDRALVISHADEERVVRLAEPLRDSVLRAGDSLLLEPRSGYVYERIPKAEVEELILEEVPDITYSDIGGLGSQIVQIRDAVELPYLHADLFREHQLRPPKGVLLYGPPGCGKTLIAKAVANSLAKQVAARTAARGRRVAKRLTRRGAGSGQGRSRAGWPGQGRQELLPEHQGPGAAEQVRRRDRAAHQAGVPAGPREGQRGHAGHRVLRRDGLDLPDPRVRRLQRRGEHDRAPAAVSEIDGVEGLENVIVIGASNREDMIDPAILRPGRLDVKIKIERPDAEAAKDIFSKYVLTELPLHPDDLAEHGSSREATVDAMIQRVVERMYSETEENRFLEVTYANGDKEVLYFKDFNSGAMIENIVARAKKMAIKEFLDTGQKGMRVVASADRLRGRVQRERGPAEHHQPGRLGPHLRQEGRADRVHQDPRFRQAGHRGRAFHRHGGQYWAVPLTWAGAGARPPCWRPRHRYGPGRARRVARPAPGRPALGCLI